MFNSATVDVIPFNVLICAAVEVTATPEIFQLPAVRLGVIAVVPSSRLSNESKFVLIFVPQELSLAPTSGLVKE